MSPTIFHLYFWHCEWCVVNHQSDYWSESGVGNTRRSFPWEWQYPYDSLLLSSNTVWRTVIFIFFLVQSGFWCHSCQSECEKVRSGGRLQHDFSSCWWWKVLRISQEIFRNSVNQVQKLEERDLLSSLLLINLKKNKSFLLLKTNFPRASGLPKCLACGWLTSFMLRYHAVISNQNISFDIFICCTEIHSLSHHYKSFQLLKV